MPRVAFTAHLAQIGPPEVEVEGGTIGAALAAVFRVHPRLKGYILDDQERLRQHIAVFVDGRRLANEDALAKSVAPHTEIYVLQALSGG